MRTQSTIGGWATRKGLRNQHFVSYMGGATHVFAASSVCGTSVSGSKRPWRPVEEFEELPKCRQCEAKVAKHGYERPEVMAPFTTGSWASLRHLSRTHFVPYLDGTRKLAIASMCGSARTDEHKHKVWDVHVFDDSKPRKPHCKRCLEALEKERGEQVIKELERKTTHASQIQMSVVVSDDTIPVAWVPVPDLEQVIQMLQRQRPAMKEHPCRVVNDTLDVTIMALRSYIDEAKERNEKKPEMTTWVHTGKEDTK